MPLAAVSLADAAVALVVGLPVGLPAVAHADTDTAHATLNA